MKLSIIKYEHILEAALYIDQQGIPIDYLSNNYWVKFHNDREYPFKYLIRIAYKYANGNKEEWLEFESNENYRSYIEGLGFFIVFYKESINFFKEHEINHFQIFGGGAYRKANKEDVRKGELLKPLVYKLNKWAELSLIENLTFKRDRTWQWSGSVKPYLWIKIFRPGSTGKVFFVIGVTNNGGLFYKIDCIRSEYIKQGALSYKKQQEFDEYLEKTDYEEQFIPKHELKSMTWGDLIYNTSQFLYKYLSLYDDLEILANSKNSQTYAIIEETAPPKKTKSYVSKQRTFEGKCIDWKQKNLDSQLLGNAGEKFVIELERKKLLKVGLIREADKVCKMLDGVGYDILSFDEKGKEIYIEVKTTIGAKDEPFYFSINEKEYFESKPEGYRVYRLYNFRFKPNRAKYFVLYPNELIKWKFKPINFEVSLNSE